MYKYLALGYVCDLFYASTCTLYVDPLQAPPAKCWWKRSRYGRTCSFYMYSYHRAYIAYYLVLGYMGINYDSNSTSSIYAWHCAQSTGRLAAFSANCNCIIPLLNMYVLLWGSSCIFLDVTHARGAQICCPYVRVFFRRGECLYHMALGVWLLGDSDGEYIKNTVQWKLKHRAGPLDWCRRPHVYRKPRSRGK